MGKIIDYLLAKPTIASLGEKEHLASQKAILSYPDGENLICEIQKLRNLRHMLLENCSHTQSGYEGFDYTINLLKKNGLGNSFINYYAKVIETQCTIAELRDTKYMFKELTRFLKEHILIYQKKEQKTKQRIIMLVGASGVGKTSATFMLAGHFNFDNSKTYSLRIACLDNHNLVAKEQFEKFKGYMELEGEFFINHEEFIGYVRKGKRPEILLVDTPGKSPKNKKEITRMANILSPVFDKGEIFLVIPANISEQDMFLMLEEFKLFSYDGIILTKMDEAKNPAAVLGVSMEYQLPVAYISFGKDIENFIPVNTEILFNYFKGLQNERSSI